jgi:hypothetical protein
MFASNIDFLCMKVKPFCLHKTEGANNHIEQGDALIFARNPIGVTYDQLAAMLTSVIHDFFHWQTRCHIWTDCHQYWKGKSVAFNGLRRHFVHQTRNDSRRSGSNG